MTTPKINGHALEGLPTARDHELVTAERDNAVRLLAVLCEHIDDNPGYMAPERQEALLDAKALATKHGFRKARRTIPWCGK